MKNISVCGANCGECKMFAMCGGCNKVKGKVFYRQGQQCPVYACASKMPSGDCSKCDILKCKIFVGTKDPKMTDEQWIAWCKVKEKNLKDK